MRSGRQKGTGVSQSSQSRTFTYTSLGRLSSAINPESGTIRYTYYSNGNLHTRTDNGNVATTYTYDALNRVVTKSYSDGTPTVTFTYGTSSTPCSAGSNSYSIGRLCSVANSVSTTSFPQYDPAGHVLASSQATGGGSNLGFGYAWNRLGGLLSETYPSSRTINYTYDAGGRVNTVSGMLNSVATPYAGSTQQPITYAPHHALSLLPLGNRIIESWSYNDRLQPTGMQAGGLLVLNFYPCDGGAIACTNNNGNIWRETIASAAMSGSVTQEYRYDMLNRLEVAVESPSAGVSASSSCIASIGGNWCQQFGYDAYGNRSVNSYSGGMSPATNTPIAVSNFDGSNHITVNSAQPDAGGNLQQIGGSNGQSFAYDAENRLITVSSGSSTIASYAYDGDGRRVQETAGGLTTTYIYDALGDLAAEYINGTVAPALCTTCYLTADYLGSTRMMTGGTGNAVSLHDYQPFGEEISGGVGGRSYSLYDQLNNPRQKFTGKERDIETANSFDPYGLDFFGARYFSSAQGRFTSPDEFFGGVGGAFEVGHQRRTQPGPLPYADVTNPQSLNKYVYALNNPLRFIDPDGHEVALTGSDQDKEEERKRLAANASKKGESDLFRTTTDKNGKTTLILDQQKAAQFKGDHSAGYNLLVGAIDAKPTITVQITNFDANTKLDSSGGALVNLNRTVSPLDRFSPLRGYNGQAIPNPFNIIAGHEVLGHALPGVLGLPNGEDVARAVENQLRQEQGLPLRDPASN
jgi:RHS repeat-associated protein